MRNYRLIAGTTLGLSALFLAGTAITVSRAQEKAPASETLEQRITRLEKQVDDLTKQVNTLKQGNAIYYTVPQTGILTNPSTINPPVNGQPFEFNGTQNYFILLGDKKTPQTP